MPPSMRQPGEPMHPVLPERCSAPAKASLLKAEPGTWRLRIGHAIQRAMTLQGWSLKEFASAVDRDERQCARWIDGTERPQMDTLFSVVALRQSLVQAFAELAGEGVEVETVIRVRRIA